MNAREQYHLSYDDGTLHSAAAALYQQTYPNTRQFHHITFSRFFRRLRETVPLQASNPYMRPLSAVRTSERAYVFFGTL